MSHVGSVPEVMTVLLQCFHTVQDKNLGKDLLGVACTVLYT